MTNRETRRATRAVAKRPPARTTSVELSGAFDGWWAEARADFPASLLIELQSGNVGRILAALDAIVTDHNLPNSRGELAATLAEVDPYDGLLLIAGELVTKITTLPNR